MTEKPGQWTSRFSILLAAWGLAVCLVAHTADLPKVPGFLPRGYLTFDPKNLDQAEPLEAPVELEEVRGWRALGGRWAGALDAKGNVIAIYDLSLSTLGPAAPVRLATIGGDDFTLNSVRVLLAAANPLDKKARNRRDKVLKLLSKQDTRSLGRNLLPTDWYLRVPWKIARVASAGAPGHFLLSDIDLDRIVASKELFSQSLKFLKRFGVELSRFDFERRPDGAYDIILLPRAHGGLAVSGPLDDRPVKMADLKSIHAGFFEQVEWAIGQSVLSFAIGLIPIPIVSAFVGTAVSRFLTYESDALWQHRQSANEMVTMSLEPATPYAAFSSLTKDELQRAGMALYLTQVSLVPVWNWIFKGARRAWRDDMSGDMSRVAATRRWFAAHHQTLLDLNPRHALTVEGGAVRYLYLLSHIRFFQDVHPVDAINFADPYRHVVERSAIEMASTLVQFGTSFIPTFGGLLASVFDWVVRNPVQGTKEREARLIALLEERGRVGRENWDRELELLELQRVNPVELSRDEAFALIARHRATLGLPPLPSLAGP